MGWSVGYDSDWDRDVGYGVPAICDQPGCRAEIDRGLYYVCCGEQPYGGVEGCGLYFCTGHQIGIKGKCERCAAGEDPFEPTPDVPEWINHKLTDESWATWRADHPELVAKHSGAPATARG